MLSVTAVAPRLLWHDIYIYCSYQLYTRNTGLSNCILGMDNLTGYVHVPVKFESFWKRIFIKNAILNFVLLVGTFGIFVK